MSLLVLLVTGLSTSSFFLNDYLTKTINKNKHSSAQFDFALRQDNLAVLRLSLSESQQYSQQWLVLATTLAKTQGDVAYQLAIYYQEDSSQALFWYKSAIRLNYHKASIALARHYFQQNKLNNATETLAALPVTLSQKLNTEANILKVNIAINRGDVSKVKLIINEHAQQLQKTIAGRLLLADINKYQLLIDNNKDPESGSLKLSCDNSIQLFATNLNHLKHLEGIIKYFEAQVLNQAVCFSSVRYMAINGLDCSNEQEKAIRCNELNWQPWASSIDTRYVGIMLPKGGANVHLGILYFDAQDSVDVIAHEVSHLLGFVDEYPLTAEHVKCRASQKISFSQNISVLKKTYLGDKNTVRIKVLKQIAWAKHIKKSTPILQPVTSLNDEKRWELGTPMRYKDDVGLFNAQTCDNSIDSLKEKFSAFKPVLKTTKLQYFSLDFPKLYSTLIEENSMQYLMPSFHYNIALAYFQQSTLQQNSFQKTSVEQANYWLEQSAKWERDAKRIKKVRQGAF